jgi:hypothetical protein
MRPKGLWNPCWSQPVPKHLPHHGMFTSGLRTSGQLQEGSAAIIPFLRRGTQPRAANALLSEATQLALSRPQHAPGSPGPVPTLQWL